MQKLKLQYLGHLMQNDSCKDPDAGEDCILRKKVMTNLDSILKSRDITLPTKVRLVKAMVFPVVMYGCERVGL